MSKPDQSKSVGMWVSRFHGVQGLVGLHMLGKGTDDIP
jgi:hypothetical protein